MPNWDEIRNEYETSKITLQALADKHDVKIGTLKSRKSREGWSRNPTKKDATKNQKVATLKKKDASPQSEPEIIKEDELDSDRLTDKQRLFCFHYVKSFNATQSAIKAGYSLDTAHVQGPRLLGNVRVKEFIQRMKKEMTGNLFIDAQDVLNKWVKIAFADITDFVDFGQKEQPEVNALTGEPILDENGEPVMYSYNYVDFKNANEVDGTLITEVKKGKDGISVKLADKMKALDKLSLYFDLFPDKFKRQVEEEKLKISHHKVFGANEEEEYEDDGFEAALDATTSEVWNNDTNED